MSQTGNRVSLRRHLGFWALLVYGVGDILGAGIYVLVGAVAGLAGRLSWASFGTAMLVAALTALTYAELVARHPQSGGEAYFCERAFHKPWLAQGIGWLVFASGLVSLATISRAFAAYVAGGWSLGPEWLWILALLLLLGVINLGGIHLSSRANILCTAVEASGLLFVLAVGMAFLLDGSDGSPPSATTADGHATWVGVLKGGALAFFAFIGFEDMVNVAEEVKRPKRNFPPAILVAVAIAGVSYMAIAAVATRVVAPGRLAVADAPLLEVLEVAGTVVPGWVFTAVALFAVANTGLLNFIMASRLIYGMADRGLLPAWSGGVNSRFRTPHWAILVVFVVALSLALSGTLGYLAGTTSALILGVFLTMHLALIRLKAREPHEGFSIPRGIPLVGFVACSGLALFLEVEVFLSAVAIAGLGLLLIGGYRHYAGP